MNRLEILKYLETEYLPHALQTWDPESIKPLIVNGNNLSQDARSTPSEYYLWLGFDGEWGEVCELLKRQMRDGVPHAPYVLVEEFGDALWYAAILWFTAEDLRDRLSAEYRILKIEKLARAFGFTIQDICERNIAKLADRKARGVIQGKGGDR